MEKLVLIIVLLILIAIFISLGIIALKKDRKIKREWLKTVAKITKKRNWTNKSVVFTLEYHADGELIEREYRTTRLYGLQVGQTINIFYKENNPKNFFYENDIRYILWAGLLFFSSFIWFMSIFSIIFRK